MLTLVSCDSLSERLPWLHAKPSSEGVIAQVGTHALYEEEIRAVTRGSLNADDSTRMADAFIQNWATEWLLYDNAKRQLGNQQQLDQLVEDYRRALYVHEYEQLLISRRMPTDIEPDSMLAYYERYGDRMLLDEDIIRGIMIILPADAKQLAQLKKWLAKGELEIDNIENYAYQTAIGYQFFVEEWQPLQKIIAKIPADEKKLISQLKYHNLIEVKNEDKIYLLQVTDKHFAGEQMPFDYAQSAITHAILEQRKTDFTRKHRLDIYNKWERAID